MHTFASRLLHLLLSLSCVAHPPSAAVAVGAHVACALTYLVYASAAVAVGTVACALTYLCLPRRSLELNNNAITSLAGVAFPASLS